MAAQFPNGLSVHDGTPVAAGVAVSGTSMSHQPASGASASGYAFNLATGAATASAVSAQDGGDLSLSAGTSAGDHVVLVPNATDGEVQCSSRPITGVADPTNDQDVATKAYVDTNISTAGGDFTWDSSKQNLYSSDSALDATSGTNHVVAGHMAGDQLATGSDANLLMGWRTGRYITTGRYNVCLGMSAGTAITTDDHNVCIGRNAGSGSGASESNNVFIGYDAGTHTSAYTNVTCLGYNAQVTGSNQVKLGDSNVTTYTNAITVENAVTGGSLTDGTATLTGGALSGVTTIIASGAVVAGGISSAADVNLNDSRVINVADPTNDQDAATKAYVDTEVGRMDTSNTFTWSANANVTITATAVPQRFVRVELTDTLDAARSLTLPAAVAGWELTVQFAINGGNRGGHDIDFYDPGTTAPVFGGSSFNADNGVFRFLAVSVGGNDRWVQLSATAWN